MCHDDSSDENKGEMLVEFQAVFITGYKCGTNSSYYKRLCSECDRLSI